MGAAKGTKADRLEKLVARRLGLEQTRGSGSVRGDGDGKTPYKQRIDSEVPAIMVETKHTEKEAQTLSVKIAIIDETVSKARRRGLIPVVVKQYGDEEPYVVMKLEDFERLYKSAMNNEN